MMNIKITGKELKTTDAIKEYVEKKMERIQKYFEEANVVVTIKTEGTQQIAEMHLNANQDVYRAVSETRDLYASIDKDIDILEGQIRKMKTKRDKQNKEDSIKQREIMNGIEQKTELENEIIKTVYYEAKPMSLEDAKLKLQERPQNIFYTFINIDTNKVNVIFKLKDSKNYGVVEPEV